MVVNSSTFISDLILFLRNYLRTNISDPISRAAGGSGFIMTAYPVRATQYPIITIKSTGIDTTRLGLQSTATWNTMKVEVRVWARNAKESDNLTEQVITTLRNAQFISSTGTVDNSIYDFKLESCVPLVENEGEQNRIHSKIMTYNWKVLLTT